MQADLRVDANRDGKVDLTGATDQEGKGTWTAKSGAVFLANIDDDEKTCAYTAAASDDELNRLISIEVA